ncbi:ABC transporter ATP-binding protein [Fodinicola feengrottensis]|uniref:ABC transporter ATP-binding protein n=1 Tax=Fodinicola feengrottensis TaxID=435914 RepID=A0ABN2JCP8_9ACTN
MAITSQIRPADSADSAAGQVTPAVRLTGLTKKYKAVTAVDALDLTLEPGQVVALLGPNGAGKSTTVDMMLGLTRPTSGQIALFGQSVRQAADAGMVGAMLQNSQLPDDVTVAELVNLYAGLHRKPLPLDLVLDRAGIADLAKRRTAKLSGGQKQRVRFALAIVADPRLLVLDEPTAAMDVQSRRDFWAAMRRLTGGGRTIIFATHYLEEADEFADRIVLLRAGKVVADGSGAQIKSAVSGRQVAATVPGATLQSLAGLPGVEEATLVGDRATMRCSDSDAAIRALLPAYPQATDIEIRSLGLEEAFLALTTEEAK